MRVAYGVAFQQGVHVEMIRGGLGFRASEGVQGLGFRVSGLGLESEMCTCDTCISTSLLSAAPLNLMG